MAFELGIENNGKDCMRKQTLAERVLEVERLRYNELLARMRERQERDRAAIRKASLPRNLLK